MFNGIVTILIGYLLLFLLFASCIIILLDRVSLAGVLYSKQRERPWYIQIFYEVLPVLIVIMVVRTYLVEPFSIPSESMYPQLTQGDYVLVNKTSSALKFPFTNTSIIQLHELNRGDVFVFQNPLDTNMFFIKRMIAKGGDTVKFSGDDLYINNQIVPRTLAKGDDIPIEPGYRFSYEQLGEHRYLIRRTMQIDSEKFSQNSPFLQMRADRINNPNLIIDANKTGSEDLTITIPKGYYFFMGDNRDHSLDSRAWGLVQEDLIVGRTSFVYHHFLKRISHWNG